VTSDSVTDLSTVSLETIQRRTVLVLAVAQALSGVGITIGIAAASLLAKEISGSESQAGLAQTFQVLGAAVASYFLARWMSQRGRRFGLTVGLALGAAGSLLLAVAGVLDSMVVLLVGAALLGATTSASLSARYAATDLAPDATRGRALSTVVWATTIGTVAGPNLAGPSAALAARLGLPELAGPFALGSVGILASSAVVWVWLRPDPLILARAAAATPPPTGSGLTWSRVGEVLRDRPAVAAAIIGLSAAHAVMVAVMVMTPLHMAHGGAELRIIGVVISVHVLGMFAFSPLVGWAADAWGRWQVLAAAGVILLLSLLVSGSSPEGSSWEIFVGLFLLGFGWSCATVAGSTLIADQVPLDARTDVQGASDLIMGLVAAAAGGASGVVMATSGYSSLAAYSVVLAVCILVAALVARRSSLTDR
jgi:MFS family permease